MLLPQLRWLLSALIVSWINLESGVALPAQDERNSHSTTNVFQPRLVLWKIFFENRNISDANACLIYNWPHKRWWFKKNILMLRILCVRIYICARERQTIGIKNTGDFLKKIDFYTCVYTLSMASASKFLSIWSKFLKTTGARWNKRFLSKIFAGEKIQHF